METPSNPDPPPPPSSTLPEQPQPQPQPQQPPPPPPRRRAGPQKRKSSTNPTSAPPAKRLIKERNALNISSLHNGPRTRGRQLPNDKPPPDSSAPSPPPLLDGPPKLSTSEEERLAAVFQEEEEPLVDAAFEEVRSRGQGVHVVPTPAGWFSWREVHPLEKHSLASFFTGKSESRTPEIYMEIRNSIMKKFHANPQAHLELKDLPELSVGDSDARQEVMEFLDYWGLINFHPFPPLNPEIGNSDAEVDKLSPLVEKLYQFEMVQSCPHNVRKKVEVSAPESVPRFLPAAAIADDLAAPVGPSVEYHCNSCSADCSRKRYHCQKQADFDLCSDCYNSGKFGSGMSPADFILMEPAEVPGVSGGSWTDQETLLLLEALELFGENWNEIAEHVATKTKAQCIFHFLQMPIEDPFLESNDDDDNIQEKDPGSANRDASYVSETRELENAVGEDGHVSSPTDVSKREDVKEVELPCETGASIAIVALKDAFHAIGYSPEQGGDLSEQEGLPSFAEAGNPVMALAAFLARIVEPDVATTSFRSSLKAMSENSPGIQLATRHCFVLEDPPSDKNDPPVSQSTVSDMGNEETVKGENQIPVSSDIDESKDHTNNNEKSAVPVENGEDPTVSLQDCLQKLPAEKESGDSVVEAITGRRTKNADDTPGEQMSPSAVEDVSEAAAIVVLSSSNSKEPGDLAFQGDVAPSAENETKDVEGAEEEKHAEEEKPDFVKDPGDIANETKDLGPAGQDKQDSVKESGNIASVDQVEEISAMSKAEDMKPSSILAEEKQNAATGLTFESIGIADGDDKVVLPSNEKNCSSTDATGAHDINQLKRAAVTALSAAAVKAKLLANQEEDQIRQLVSLIIEKQLHKLESKLTLFAEIESVIKRGKEQTDKARQRLIHERAQIIAARLGLPAPNTRPEPPSLTTSKFAMGYSAMSSRPPTMASQKPPPVRRP